MGAFTDLETCPAPSAPSAPQGASAACAAGPPMTVTQGVESLGFGVCWVTISSNDTIMLNCAPPHILTFVRAIADVKKECREANVFKITFAGRPFAKAINTSKNVVSLLKEFQRIGYRLQHSFRSPFSASDTLVLQCADKLTPMDAPTPQMWALRMDLVNAYTIDAPADICAQLARAFAQDCTISREKCDGNVKEFVLKSQMSAWTSLKSNIWVYPAHKTIALMKTIEYALDNGWKIVESVGVGQLTELADTVVFAHGSTPNLTPVTVSERRTTGGIVGLGIGFNEMNGNLDLVIMNALAGVEAQLSGFVQASWGGKLEKQGQNERYTRLSWGTMQDATVIRTGDKQSKMHKTTHLMFDLFVFMRNLGYELITKVRCIGRWTNVMMFRYCPDLVNGRERVQYVGVARSWVDHVSIVRPLMGDTALPNAIQNVIEKNWTPGLKNCVPPSDKTGDVHSFAMRGCPWIGRESGIMSAAFSGICASSLNLACHLNNAVLNTGVELCAEITSVNMGSLGGGHLCVYKKPLPDVQPESLNGFASTAQPLYTY